jgi:putative ABC transport system permease protein
VLSDFHFRLRALVRRRAVETEMDEELRFHFEREVDKHMRRGFTRDEALRQARMTFGGFDQVKEECRDARGVRLMETLMQDVRYALRMLWKAPGFTAIALLTLALGIGANTAIFSVVYGVLLRPLPYADPASLIVLNETTPKVGTVSVSYPNFEDWREQSHTFSKMSAVVGVSYNLAGISQPESINGYAVSPNFLSMMGIRPILGRDFDASEEKSGTAPVVILNYQLWQSHFGGNAGILGQKVALDGGSFTIVGVLPPDFRSIDKADVLVPLGVWATGNSSVKERGDRGDMVVIGRLAPGTNVAQARAEMTGIAARLAAAYPAENSQFSVLLQPIRDAFVGDIRPAILVLSCAVMFVLLIACANVANLLLMRGAGRTKEISLRIALGAGHGRIIFQMLAESLVLASLGGVLGVMLAAQMIHGLMALIPPGLLAGATVQLNGVVLLFAAVVVVFSALLFGLVPAAQLAKPDVQAELRESGRTSSASTRQLRLRDLLAVGEIAVALILLVGAGLMMKSVYRLLSVNPGFKAERVLTMQMELRSSQYQKDPAIRNFWRQVLDRVGALPGVETAALGTAVPMTQDHSRTDITIEGMGLYKPGTLPHPDIHMVSPEYLGALGISLLSGRGFQNTDAENMPRVGILNEMIARRFFAGTDPVGKRFTFGRVTAASKPDWITIVGVVADTKLYGLGNPARLEVYLPMGQWAPRHANLIVKSGVDPAAMTSAIRSAIGAIDKDQPIFAIATMNEMIDNSMSTSRITLILLGLFGALALVLASIGIYGVISYSVAQRTHEIGVRMALGADRSDVVRMILSHGVRIAGAGVLIGAVASFGLTRLMKKMLYSVSTGDPVTFVTVGIAMLAVAMVACYIPARRTLRVDPMIALRYE